MDRLEDKYKSQIEKLLVYTDEEREKINKVNRGFLFGFEIKIEPKVFSTVEGISGQLDRFENQSGMLYVMSVKRNGVVDIQFYCVKLKQI